MDRSGRRFRLQNIDPMGYDARTSDPLYKHIPFYIARKPKTGAAVGLFYDTLSDCAFDFGCEHSNYHGPYRSFEAEHGDLDLYVIAGPKIADITRRFTWLTGRPAATPDWALGYSGSTMSYTDAPDAQGQMGKFLTSLAEHDIPCTSFHFSSGYTSIGDKRYVFHWNRDKFPDPKAFVQSYAINLATTNLAPVMIANGVPPASVPGAIGTRSLRMTSPPSTVVVTLWTMTPVWSVRPSRKAACARAIAWAPSNSPGSAGCRLMTRSGKRSRKAAEKMCIQPASTIRSGSFSARAAARSASYCSRERPLSVYGLSGK